MRRLSGRHVTARIGTVVTSSGLPPSDGHANQSLRHVWVAIHLPSGDHTGRENASGCCEQFDALGSPDARLDQPHPARSRC